MRKHTTLNIDTELVEAARVVLGTNGTTETVHRALEEVVNAHKRLWLLEHDFSNLTPETLDEIRRERAVGEMPGLQPA